MNKEISLSGSPGSPGIVIGTTSLFKRKFPDISAANIGDGEIEKQLKQFTKACHRAEHELQQLLEEQESESAIELIKTQIAMIRDPDLCERVEAEIKEHNQAADAAIKSVFEEYLAVMEQNRDEQGLDRSIDITDVRDRLIQLVNHYPREKVITEGTILVARELSPREVIEFSDQNIKGIIMDRGGTTSHAVIIARSMNIPAVVGLKKAANIIDDEKEVILDGNRGEVIINPQTSTRGKYERLILQQAERRRTLETVCTQENETADGHPFKLRANIEFAEELNAVHKYRADGIGLLRTESVYLRREHFGNQQKQEAFYSTILEGTKPHPVMIRLFDAGGDKFFKLGQKEENPFLGWRGIRMLLDDEELLKNQLTAILKTAGRYPGRVQILAPMISTIEEVFAVKKLITAVQHELKNKSIPIDTGVAFGVMVEVPSVALQAELFAHHTDILSIGTNDLTQYVLAVDRGNELITNLYAQHHPAMWQIIKHVADAGQKEHVPVAVCGELASDPTAACILMGLGINDLSVSPNQLPSVKEMLRKHSLKEMQQLSSKILKSETVEHVNRIYDEWK